MTRICIIRTIEGHLGDNAIYDLENYQNEFKMHAIIMFAIVLERRKAYCDLCSG